MINRDSQLAKEFWHRGRLPSCPVVDFHGHMYGTHGMYLPRAAPEEMLRTMDACNVAIVFFCGHPALTQGGAGIAKDIAAVREHPERFRAYHPVLSRCLDPDADLRRLAENPDVYVGLKFHPDWYGIPLSDPRHDPYWDYADERGLVVLSHTWGGSQNDGPDEVAKILAKYPNLVFIAGHSFHDEWRRGPELTREYPNLYLELTAVLDDRGPLDMIVEDVGSNRILFGTDLPWFSTHHGIGAVLSAEMSDDDRRNIFYRNGETILRRFDWFDSLWSRLGPCPAM